MPKRAVALSSLLFPLFAALDAVIVVGGFLCVFVL